MSYVHASRLLHRWNCTIAHAISRLRAGAAPDAGTTARQVECRSISRMGSALLTVTVDEADVSRVRGALCYCGPHSVEFVTLTRIPREHRVRLQIALKAEAVSEAMSKIIGSVKEAEFGRTTLRPNHRPIRGIQQMLHRWNGALSQSPQGEMTRGSLG